MQANSEAARILVIDDEPDQLRLLMHILQSAGYTVDMATDGAKGVARAISSSPDLILLDVIMPRMGGLAAARMLKADPLTALIPIVFLSCAVDTQTRVEGLRAGAVDYITKPYHAEEVQERVRIHLELANQASQVRSASMAEIKTLEYSTRTGLSAEKPLSAQKVIVRAVESLLKPRIGNPPTLKELSKALEQSERAIHAAFEDVHGDTYFGFVRKVQMQRAKELLRATSLKVADISDELGYSSPANFATAFRDYTGLTPSQFRKSDTAE